MSKFDRIFYYILTDLIFFNFFPFIVLFQDEQLDGVEMDFHFESFQNFFRLCF